jgi:Leucine-rich repeat (LRR) protein
MDNGLSGDLPNTFNTLTNLEILNLRGNEFTGALPESISQASQLTTLSFGENNFIGTIPLSYQNLTNLDGFNADNNHLDFIPSFDNAATIPPALTSWFNAITNTFIKFQSKSNTIFSNDFESTETCPSD